MDPKTVVARFWTDYAKGDLDVTWATYVSPDLVIHPASGFAFDRGTWLEAEKGLHEAFDDVRVEVLDQVADGNKVATRWAVTAVQKADFLGVPSTGRAATLTGTTFDVVVDDQIVEHWAEVGVAVFLRQLSGE